MNKITKVLLGTAVAGFHIASCDSSVKGDIAGIETLQYRANDPIEDRVCYSRIKRIKGVVAAVFDGHGGDLVVNYTSHRLSMLQEI